MKLQRQSTYRFAKYLESRHMAPRAANLKWDMLYQDSDHGGMVSQRNSLRLCFERLIRGRMRVKLGSCFQRDWIHMAH